MRATGAQRLLARPVAHTSRFCTKHIARWVEAEPLQYTITITYCITEYKYV
jgi:hypothetical protein